MTPAEGVGLTCPVCGGKIPAEAGPNRYGGIQVVFHDRNGRARKCPFVVVPDPVGEDHWTEAVPKDQEAYQFAQAVYEGSEEVRRRCLAAIPEQMRRLVAGL